MTDTTLLDELHASNAEGPDRQGQARADGRVVTPDAIASALRAVPGATLGRGHELLRFIVLRAREVCGVAQP
jgi:hypothetical protein